MSILDTAIADARRILGSTDDWSTVLTVTPTGEADVEIVGFAVFHSTGLDENGIPVVSDNSYVTFAEKDLNDLGVTTRDANGNLIIQNWKIGFSHDIGSVVARMREPMPDPTLGIITVRLVKWQQ